jgi:hypothetical protein
MGEHELIEPKDDTNINTKYNPTDDLKEIINNHIKNSVLLFNLQNKLIKKLEDQPNNMIELIDKLVESNSKIDDYIFYNFMFLGIGVITFGVITILNIKKN